MKKQKGIRAIALFMAFYLVFHSVAIYAAEIGTSPKSPGGDCLKT